MYAQLGPEAQYMLEHAPSTVTFTKEGLLMEDAQSFDDIQSLEQKFEASSLSSSRCRPLPVELWPKILSYVDDFSLWVDCRRVCKMFRAEAEKIFANMRLPYLTIKWAYGGNIRGARDAALIQYTGTIELGDFMGLESQDLLARFAFKKLDRDCYYMPRLPNPDPELDEHYTKDTLLKCLQYRELDYSLRFRNGNGPLIAQASWLGSYNNDVELPGFSVDLDARQICFEWRTFLNTFYGDYAYVRRMCNSRGAPAIDVVDGAEKDLVAIFGCRKEVISGEAFVWTHNFGDDSDGLFWQAYLKRLKRSHDKAGQTLYKDRVDKQLAQNILNHVNMARQQRNTTIVRDFLERHSIEMTRMA